MWTIAPEMVAGTMDDFGKAVKKLSLCLVAIAPGHTAQWEGQELSFRSSCYGQVQQELPGRLNAAARVQPESRIAFIDGHWAATRNRLW